MKVLCVLLPHFPLHCEAVRQPESQGRPALVTSDAGSQKLVLDCSPELEDLQPGMPLQQALSRHGDVDLFPADVPYYWSVFNEILDALETKSPMVEGSDLGSAYIGLDGLQLIYRTDNDIVNSIREVIPGLLPARLGIAEGKFLAYLAALYSPPSGYRTLSGDVAAFLKDLSCDVLPVSARNKSKLHDFGIHTLGQATALPTGPIQAQFGPEGIRIRDLARGLDETPLHPRCLEEIIEANATLSSVTVSIETLLMEVESLLVRVFAGNGLKGRGIRALTLWTRTWDAEHWERHIQFKEPAMDIKSALRRIKQFLENYPQPGPVEQLGIKLTRLGFGLGRQRSIFTEVRAQDHLLEDVKQLELRLDSPQIFKVKEVEPWSRIPERRYALTPLSQ